jgi:putative FmdB family regulatory protein
MPTYEYRCKDCGATLEVVQSFTEPSLTECRTCGGRLRKVFGNVGISFKGSGFYRTDSRSAASASSSGDKGGAKESGNGDSSSSSSGSDGAKGSKDKADKKSEATSST